MDLFVCVRASTQNSRALMRSNQISKKGHLLFFTLTIANLWFLHTWSLIVVVGVLSFAHSFCRVSFVIKLTVSHCCVFNIQYAFIYILYLYNISIKNMHPCLCTCTVDVLNYSFMLLVMCDSLFFYVCHQLQCGSNPGSLTHTHAHNFSRSQRERIKRVCTEAQQKM